MSKLQKKLKTLIQVRAGYNDSLLKTQSDKRRKLVQSWADEINLKIIIVESQIENLQ